MRLLVVVYVAMGVSALAQTADRLTFEVVSVKPSLADAFDTRIQPLPGGQTYVARNMSVRQMFSFLYRIPIQRLSGGPGWLDDTRWDIDAKAARSHNLDELHAMFRNLLVDEFKLRFHTEQKEGPVYALLVDKSGLKMKADTSQEELKSPIARGPKGEAIGKRVPIDYLCWWLASRIGRDERTVIDETGLKGFYDFTLEFLPELPPGYDISKLPQGMSNWPSIFTALKEQLGLKLEAKKGPVSAYVIDAAEKPLLN